MYIIILELLYILILTFIGGGGEPDQRRPHHRPMGPGAGAGCVRRPRGDRRPPEPGAQRPDPAGRGQADPGRLGRGGGICGPLPG